MISRLTVSAKFAGIRQGMPKAALCPVAAQSFVVKHQDYSLTSNEWPTTGAVPSPSAAMHVTT